MPDQPTPTPATSGKRPRYFYGWNIVGAAFMAHLAYAEQFSSTLGLFFRPFQAEFGWTRVQISVVQTIARAMEALAAPAVGPLIDRYGPRLLIPTGAVIVGVTMLAITQVTVLWQFYLLRGVVAAVGFTLMGFLVTSVAVNNWFVRKRGRAIAIANVGSSLSNVVMMPVTVFVLAVSGWRTMFVVFAALSWLLVLVPSAIFMRRRPEDMGLHPDGVELEEDDETPQEEERSSAAPDATLAPEPVWTRPEAMRTSAFWMLAGSFAISSLAFQGINISMAPYLQDLGYGDAMVAAALTVRAIVMATTLPVVGLIAERAHRAPVRALPFALQGLGALLFLLAGNPLALWPAVAVYGMGVTSIGVTQEVVWANYYGRLSLGRIRSLGFLVTFGFGATGPIVMNAIFDFLGSYRPALLLFVGLFTIGAVTIIMTRPPRPVRYATVEEMASSPTGPAGPSAH